MSEKQEFEAVARNATATAERVFDQHMRMMQGVGKLLQAIEADPIRWAPTAGEIGRSMSGAVRAHDLETILSQIPGKPRKREKPEDDQ